MVLRSGSSCVVEGERPRASPDLPVYRGTTSVDEAEAG